MNSVKFNYICKILQLVITSCGGPTGTIWSNSFGQKSNQITLEELFDEEL